MLNSYISTTRELLNDENGSFYSNTDLSNFINLGRGTIASQAECLIANGTLGTINTQQTYALAAVTPPNAGLLNAVNVRSVRSIIAGQGAMLEAAPWQWFTNYYLTGPNTTVAAAPTVWALQNQGVAGTLWFWGIPNGTVILSVEAAWTPVPLSTDSTPEALTYPWTDAVPYFAAYMAYLNAQRNQDADRMLNLFNVFMKASRIGVTPEIAGPTFPNLKGLQAAIDTFSSQLGQVVKPSSGGEGGLG